MANVVSTEVVEFKAEGADDVLAKMRQVQTETDGMAERMKAAGEASRKQFEKFKTGADGAAAAMRNAWTTDRGSDDLAKQARIAVQMGNQLKGGASAFHAQMQKVWADGLAKSREISALLGKAPLGAGARSAFGSIPAAGGIMAAGGVGATWAKGFSGTLEAGRMDREFELLGREVAGIFKPVTDSLTEAIRSLRQTLEKLTPNQQSALAATGIAAAGGYGVSKATGGGFVGGTLTFMAGLKMIDNLQQAYEGMKYGKSLVQREVFGGNVPVSKEESDSYGYRNMTEDQLGKESKKINDLRNKHADYQASVTNAIGMSVGSTLKVFGSDIFGVGQTSWGEHWKAGSELLKRQQEIRDIRYGRGQEDGDGPNEKRRRVTADNISYGELGSSYEEATLGLMKVNAGGDSKDANDYLRDIARYLKKMSGEEGVNDPDRSLDEHPVANLTR